MSCVGKMDTFEGKVVIVTGSSSGIGEETAVCFAARGAKVVITGRRAVGVDGTVKRCREAGAADDHILTVIGDVRNKDDIARIVDSTVERFGQIDILVNNAGATVVGYFDDATDDDLMQMYTNNTMSVFNMTKKAMPWLLKTRGNVVNVSSLAGHRIYPVLFAYAMSKAALDQFTKCLAIEYAAKGVRINSVNPSTTETPIFRRAGWVDETPEALQTLLEEYGKYHPMQRVAQPSEVAASILFLASDQASFTTGMLLPVDGGRAECIQGAIVE